MQTKTTYHTFLVIISCLFMNATSVLAETNTPGSSFSIDFELVKGLILLEARVDHKKGKYILDTGCSFIAIDGSSTDHTIEVGSTEFSENASETSLNNFELGSIKRKNVSALTFDMQKIEELLDTDIDGLIGTQMIEDYNIMIDYAEMKVYFLGEESPQLSIDVMSHTIMKSDIHTVGDKSYMDVRIKDESYTVLLDSGANISVFDNRLKERFKHIHELNESSSMEDDYTINQLTINRVKIEQLGILYRDLSVVQSEMKEHQIDGILSLSSLNVDKVLFNYKSGRVIFFWAHEEYAIADQP